MNSMKKVPAVVARRESLSGRYAETLAQTKHSGWSARFRWRRTWAVLVAVFWMVCSFEPVSLAGEATAFALIKEGNRYVGEQAKDKVVQIRSDRSVGGLSPNIWYVVFYDSTATLKAVEVKFAAGKMQDVKRPLRLIEPVTGGDLALGRDKLKVDSDAAIKIAMKETLLENLKVTSTGLKMERV